jgi:hypothetical protein
MISKPKLSNRSLKTYDIKAPYLASNPALSQVLGHQTIFQIAETGSLLEVVLGQEHIPETKLLGPLLQILDDLRMRSEALLRRLTNLACVDGIGGNALFLDELLDLI